MPAIPQPTITTSASLVVVISASAIGSGALRKLGFEEVDARSDAGAFSAAAWLAVLGAQPARPSAAMVLPASALPRNARRDNPLFFMGTSLIRCALLRWSGVLRMIGAARPDAVILWE